MRRPRCRLPRLKRCPRRLPKPCQPPAPPPSHQCRRSPPTFPAQLRRRALAVIAVARFHVAKDGSATVDLLEGTPEPRLNQAVLAALHQWRFFPALDQGAPVESVLDVRIPLSVR